MPVIGTMNTFSGGAATAAATVADNFYNTDASPTSYEVINGKLDNNNREAGWDISNEMIAPLSMAKGAMTGNTGNLDYTTLTFPANNTDTGAYQPLPGCGTHFFLPYAPSAAVITWQVIFAGNLIHAGGKQLELKMYIDGTLQNRQFRVLPEGRAGATRYLHRDRMWSGHVLRTNLTAGWHTAHVACFLNQNTARIRIRNMKYVYFK